MIKKIYKRLESTNKKARELLESGEIYKPSWIQAIEQYGGRGLGENSWESEPGKNITGSLVVFPSDVSAEDQFDISIVSCLAVCDLLELYLEEVKVKWPNDIYVGSGKIAGLLIEHAVMGKNLDHSILGIGLNINQLDFSSNIPNPISLKSLLGLNLDIEELTDLLLDFIVQRVDQLSNGQMEKVRQEYTEKLYRYREYAPYRSNKRWLKARITGVGRFGHLILETDRGELLEFGFKEIEFIEE